MRNRFIRLELSAEVFASGGGWNGAAPALGDREDCLNPPFIIEEKITADFGR